MRKSRNRRPGRRRARRVRQGLVPSRVTCDIKFPAPLRMPASQTLLMEFRGYSPISTDGSGVHNSVVPFNPAVTLNGTYLSGAALFTEFSSFVALFGEVKLLEFQMFLVPNFSNVSDAKLTSAEPLAIASVSNSIYAAPGAYSVVLDNGDAQNWPYAYDSSGSARFHSSRFRVSSYASTSAPNPGSSSGVPAGCPGAIVMYATNGPLSLQIATARFVGRYRFRNRL